MSTILKKELKKTNNPKKKLVIEDSPNMREKKMTWCQEYRCNNTGDLKLAGNLLVEKLGKELREWARNNDEAIRVCEFFADKGINLFTYQNWIKKDENFASDYYDALRYLGRRREKLATYRKYNCNDGLLRSTMHQFMDEFKHDIEWQAKLRTKEDEQGGTKYVIIESVAPTDIVKPLKEKSNE